MNKTHLIAGGAGFIGANLVAKLVSRGDRVHIADNLLRGDYKFVSQYVEPAKAKFHEIDLANYSEVERLFFDIGITESVDTVWHLAANSDIPAGIKDSNVDLNNTFMTTHNLLRAMGSVGLDSFMFASSSAIYGDHGSTSISETTSPLAPISYYGAMKLASEAALSAASESFLKVGVAFRFPNVIGVPATHGVIYDFLSRLQSQPKLLEVFGDGSQQKAYLHVNDLVSAMIFVSELDDVRGYYPLNIGPDDSGVTVKDIAESCVRICGGSAAIKYGESNKGWIGDVPKFNYDVRKLTGLGWRGGASSKDAVERAVAEIYRQLNG